MTTAQPNKEKVLSGISEEWFYRNLSKIPSKDVYLRNMAKMTGSQQYEYMLDIVQEQLPPSVIIQRKARAYPWYGENCLLLEDGTWGAKEHAGRKKKKPRQAITNNSKEGGVGSPDLPIMS